jgi:hypothetical protein
VTLVRSNVSKERIASIVGAILIGELRTTLAITSNESTLRRNTRNAMYLLELLCISIISSQHAFVASYC